MVTPQLYQGGVTVVLQGLSDCDELFADLCISGARRRRRVEPHQYRVVDPTHEQGRTQRDETSAQVRRPGLR